jgi:hypothetical protein
MTPEDQKQINDLKEQLKSLADNYSNLVVFRKPVLFKSGFTGAREYTTIDQNSSASVPSGTSVWEDWDLSSFVPTTAKYVEIYIRNSNTTGVNMGVRKNGTSFGRVLAVQPTANFCTLVELDENKIIERYTANTSNVNFALMGYWS